MPSNLSMPRNAFADTRARAAQGPTAGAVKPSEDRLDADELLARADAADLHLLRLVGCAALATVLLALATGLSA